MHPYLKKLLPAIGLLALISLALIPQENGLNPQDYAAWVTHPDNGLLQQLESEHFEFSAQYKPLDYIILQEADPSTLSNQKMLAQRQHELDGLSYFEIRVQPKRPLSSEQDGEKPLQKALGDQFQENIRLVDGADTLNCVLYHLEPSFGIRPFQTLLVGFEKSHQAPSDLQILLDARPIGQEQMAFEFSSISHMPKLTL